MNKRRPDTNRRTNRRRCRRRIFLEQLEQRLLLTVDLVSVDLAGLAAGDDLPVPGVLDPSVSGTHPDLSANGKYVVFESDAEDLTDNDGNDFRDIFVRDLDSGETTLISVTPDGLSGGDADSYSAAISDEGRFITFVSLATDLTREVTVDNGFPDVYLHDRDLDGNGLFDESGPDGTATFLLSLGFAPDGSRELADGSSGGGFPVGSNFRPVISGDGSTVVFGSAATNLVDPAIGMDVNLIGEDLFAVVTTSVTKREVLTLNLDGDGTGVGLFGEGEAEGPVISEDGSVIAFQSRFSDIAETIDDPTSRQIFVRTTMTERISENTDGEGGDFVSREVVLSRDGRHVAFITPSTNLVEGDDNGGDDVYVFDRDTGLLTLVSRSADPLSGSLSGNDASATGGGPDVRDYFLSISDDGRYVAYYSLATDLLAAVDGTVIADSPGTPDIFVFDRDADEDGVFDEVDVPGATETILASINFAGTATGASGAPAAGSGSLISAISGNGRFVAFASTAIDLLEEPTSGTNVFVRDLVAGTTYLASPSPVDDPASGSGPGTLGQQTISISRDGSRVAFISDSDLDPDTVDDNGTRDVYVFTLPSFIEMQRFSADGFTSLNLRYEILNTPVDDGFSIDIVRSSDEMFSAASPDVLLATIEITDPDDLSVGLHNLSFPIGGGAGEIPLPGAGAEEPGDGKPVDYFLLAVADVDDMADGPLLVEDTAVFSGFYHPPDAPIFAHGTAGDDTITATTVDGIVTFAFSTEGGPVEFPLFPPDDVTGIRARMHDGDDMVTGSEFADLLLGGPGADVLLGEDGRDTMDGGPGDDRVLGGDGFDMLFDSTGDDFIDTGGPEPFGGTVNGVPGSDNIYIGAGEDILSFEDALLPITFDTRDTTFQIVDVANNRVQASGFTHFIGSPFDDDFLIDGAALLPFSFDGGSGSDTLNIDAGGLPAKDDGASVQVPGFEPIEYTNVERLNIFNSAPWVQAELQDELVIDIDQDNQADPGDTLRYVVTITNDSAGDALGVTFEDLLDPNTTFVPDSIEASPVVLDDHYRVVPDVQLVVSAANGLLANDFDIDGSMPGTNTELSVDVDSVMHVDGAATGSKLTVNGDGSFVYEPELGFSGVDTFTYTITDADGLDSITEGLVTLDVTALIWFVDNTAPTNGDGSLDNPFNSLAPVNGSGGVADVDQPGDTIFVFSGASSYDQQLELENDQRLIGEGDGLVIGGTTWVPPGQRPTLTNSSGHGVTLANNNTVRGLNLDGVAGSSIRADGVHGGTLENVGVNGGSTGIDILGGTGQFTFTDVTVTDPNASALNIHGGSSLVRIDGGSDFSTSEGGSVLDVQAHNGDFFLDEFSSFRTLAPTATGLNFDDADGTYDFRGAIELNGGNAGIDILGGSAGTFTFSNTDITHTGGGAAVNIEGHSGGTVTFGPDSTIAATDGPGLQFDNADGTYNFDAPITLSGGDIGIDIISDSAGTFTFSGTTTITNPTGSGSAINVADSAGADVEFDGMTAHGGENGITITGDLTGFTVIGDTVIDDTTGASIRVTNSGGPKQFGDTKIGQTTAVDSGIDISGSSAGTFTFDSLDINTSDGSGLSVHGGGAVEIGGTTNSISTNGGPALDLGDVTFTDVTFADIGSTNSSSAGIQLNGISGNFTVTGTTTVNTTPTGFAGIDIIDSPAGTFTFGSLDIDNAGEDGVTLNNAGTVTISGGAIGSVGDNGIFSTDTSLRIEPTFGTFDIGTPALPIPGDGIGFAILSDIEAFFFLRAAQSDSRGNGVSVNHGGSQNLDVVIQDNRITAGEKGIAANQVAAGTTTAMIDGNTITGDTAGIELLSSQGVLFVTALLNTLQSNFNAFRAETTTAEATIGLKLGSPPPNIDLGNDAGVYVLSNVGAFLLAGLLGQGSTFDGSDNGNVRNNGNTVAGFPPVLNQFGLFVNGLIQIVAENSIPMPATNHLVAAKPSVDDMAPNESHDDVDSAANDEVGLTEMELDAIAGSLASTGLIGAPIEIGTLPAGKSVQITFQTTINPLAEGVTQISNQGRVSGSNFATVVTDDPATAANNDPTITPIDIVRVAAADLSLVKSVNNARPNFGDEVSFTIAVNNAGPDAATNVTVADKLPAGLEFVRATPSIDYDDVSGIWTIDQVHVGATVTLDIVATITSDEPVTNVAQVASSDQFDPDSMPGNNVQGEDDQFSTVVGACLTAGPLTVGMNRLVYSCVTPGGFAPFLIGTRAGSHFFNEYAMTVDIAEPMVHAIGVGNIDGVATVLVDLTEQDLHHELMFQAFQILPNPQLSNLLTPKNSNDLLGIPLRASDVGVGGTRLSVDALPALTDAAIARWEATGLSAADAQLIRSLDVRISDLPGDQLAASHGNFILLDSTAAGNGWFVDATPRDDAEFSSDAGGALVATGAAASDDIDALTAIMHEMGHVLGKDDLAGGASNQLMSPDLPVGVRRLPGPIDDSLDVNRDGKVSALDALLIINELSQKQNQSVGFESVAGRFDQGNANYDANDDGKVSSLDALHVINRLSQTRIVQEAESIRHPNVDATMPKLMPLSVVQDSLDDEEEVLSLLASDTIQAKLT